MVEGTTTVTVSVISGGQIAECEMDALLLGRTKVSLWFVYTCIAYISLCNVSWVGVGTMVFHTMPCRGCEVQTCNVIYSSTRLYVTCNCCNEVRSIGWAFFSHCVLSLVNREWSISRPTFFQPYIFLSYFAIFPTKAWCNTGNRELALDSW